MAEIGRFQSIVIPDLIRDDDGRENSFCSPTATPDQKPLSYI